MPRFSSSRLSAGSLIVICALAQAADTTPAGLWTAVDDDTGKPSALVRIYETDGALFGRIEKVLLPGKSDRCTACTDERKDQLVQGMMIIRNLKKTPGADNEWSGGDILDPDNGTIYRSRMQLTGGGTLEVRGFIGISLFGRTQTWQRVTP